MTEPNNAQSAATHTAASLSPRLQRLMVVIVTALFGMTLSGVAFAASPTAHEAHPTVKPRAATHPPAAHPSTTATKATSGSKSKSKSKSTVALHQTQQRKVPAKARVAAKSKTPTRAHQPPRKPTKLATKQTKHAA